MQMQATTKGQRSGGTSLGKALFDKSLAFNIGKPSLSKMAGKAANFLGTASNTDKHAAEKKHEDLIDLGAGSANRKLEGQSTGFDLQPNESDLIDLDSHQISYTADFRQAPMDSNGIQGENNLGGPGPSDSGNLDGLALQQTESAASTGQGAAQAPKQTSFTTANGDGLTFDPESLNIFDQVQLIIDGRDVDE